MSEFKRLYLHPDCTILNHFFKIFSGEARTTTNGRGHPSPTLPARPFEPRENPPRLSSGSATEITIVSFSTPYFVLFIIDL